MPASVSSGDDSIGLDEFDDFKDDFGENGDIGLRLSDTGGENGDDTDFEGKRKVSLNGYVNKPGINLCMVLWVILSTTLLVYSHFGVSGVIMSNLGLFFRSRILQESPARHNVCSHTDSIKWSGVTIENTMSMLMSCNLEGSDACYTEETCVSNCVANKAGYTKGCGFCFANISKCTLAKCILNKACDSDKKITLKCKNCVKAKCFDEFRDCTGFHLDSKAINISNTDGFKGTPAQPVEHTNAPRTNGSVTTNSLEGCAALQPVYQVKFLEAVRKAWNGDARWLAAFLFVASGVWPYVKNALILLVWLRPIRAVTRRRILSWLSRLGRWSYVDIFIMILFNATLRIEKVSTSDVPFLILAFPQSGVYCFFIAATMSLIQAEWLQCKHDEYMVGVRAGASLFAGNSNGRLHSEWQSRALVKNVLHKAKLLDSHRGVLLFQCILPIICILVLIIGFFSFDTIQFTLGGMVAAFPGNNVYAYSARRIMDSVLSTQACKLHDRIGLGQILLYCAFLFGVLVLPLVICLLVLLQWFSRSQPIDCCRGETRRIFNQKVLERASAMRRVIHLCEAFVSLDVFIFSLVIVSMEVEKVVNAISSTGRAHVKPGTITMENTLGLGAYVLGFTIALLWIIQLALSLQGEANTNGSTDAKKYTTNFDDREFDLDSDNEDLHFSEKLSLLEEEE